MFPKSLESSHYGIIKDILFKIPHADSVGVKIDCSQK